MTKVFYSALIVLLIASGEVRSQTVRKVEVGAQFTTLSLPPNDYERYTEAGFGGRVTFNINDSIAIEGEGNFFPNKNVFGYLGEGRAAQAQFGVKAGRRYKTFGVFAKARPGFLTVGDVFSYHPGSSTPSPGFLGYHTRIGRETHFTTDLGGVLEFYPTRKTLVRFDAGDTVVRFGPHYEPGSNNYTQVVKVASELKHNLQITAGVGFRLGSLGSSADSNPPPASGHSSNDISRFEVGVHFTSLSMNPSSQVCLDLCFFSGDRGPVTEPGFGGRFTYNVHRNVGLEAEVNFFPGHHGPGNSNHMYQGQFGVKAGKRFDAFGLFAKFRPGFVGFTRAYKLIGTHIVTVGPSQFIVGDFGFSRREEFSMDAGGVLEMYVSRRVMTRVDFGDTIIKYREYLVPGLFLSRSIVRRPPETRHNFQFAAGVGFRF
jgi:hypothetical protein